MTEGANMALDELEKLAAAPNTSGYLDCTLAQVGSGAGGPQSVHGSAVCNDKS